MKRFRDVSDSRNDPCCIPCDDPSATFIAGVQKKQRVRGTALQIENKKVEVRVEVEDTEPTSGAHDAASPSFRVLSLFDGISCARVALERERARQQELTTRAIPLLPLDYMSSEICSMALCVTRARWPDSQELGNVTQVRWTQEEHDAKKHDAKQHKETEVSRRPLSGPLDLLIGGSPCTDLSTIGKRAGLEGPESKLFWEYVRILREAKPRYFVFENVASMMQEADDAISVALGCKPVLIDAAWFGPAVRRRKFWTNIPLDLEDLKRREAQPSAAVLADVLLTPEDVQQSPPQYKFLAADKFFAVQNPKKHKVGTMRVAHVGPRPRTTVFSPQGKLQSMTQECTFFWVQTPEDCLEGPARTLDPREVERAQGLPTNYTDVLIGGKKASRYRRGALVGLGFHVGVIQWILSHIPVL